MMDEMMKEYDVIDIKDAFVNECNTTEKQEERDHSKDGESIEVSRKEPCNILQPYQGKLR